MRRPPRSPLFPAATLFRSVEHLELDAGGGDTHAAQFPDLAFAAARGHDAERFPQVVRYALKCHCKTSISGCAPISLEEIRRWPFCPRLPPAVLPSPNRLSGSDIAR